MSTATIDKLAASALEVRNRLAVDNHGLVWAVVRRYANARRLGIELEDLAGEGTFGLLRAAELFEPARGVKFSTYATRCVENRITSYIRSARRRALNAPGLLEG